MPPIVFEQTLPALLVAWYRKNARDLPFRHTFDPYRIWVSEIMLQQTRVETALPYYERFLAALPDVQTLAACEEGQLLKLWEGLGYYSRVRNMQKAARMVVAEFGGVFPSTAKELQTLCGIGEYTAGAIASICFNECAPAVDGNVLRVAARLLAFEDDATAPAFKKDVAAALQKIYPADCPGDFTQSLMELGATVCLPNGVPRCSECPVAAQCAARTTGEPERFPQKRKKPARRVVRMTVFVLQNGGHTALQKRGDTGLLAGMWELPHVEGALFESDAQEQCKAWGCTPEALSPARERTHIFTHLEWHMRCYTIACAAAPENFIWANSDALAEQYALPTAFRKCL